MADTVAQFVAKTGRMGGELTRLEHRTVEVAAQVVKRSVQVQMVGAGVKANRLRGVGKKGARIGVRYDIDQKKALVRATGPFHLIENDTKAHRIPKQRGARARTRYAVIPGVGVRAYANHPGTKGKHPWAKGVEAAMPIQRRAQGIALHQSVARAYR
jgi:hypothetical protein